MAGRLLHLVDDTVAPEELVQLLDDLQLIPLVIRRSIERTCCKDIKPTEEKQIEFQRQFMSNEKISNVKSLDKWLKKKDMTEFQLSINLLRALQLEMFKEERFSPLVEQVFLERKSQIDMVMYSMIRTKERAKANELHLRIEEEEDTFADLASEFSEGMEKDYNGLIGPIELGRINPAIAERLRISNRGQLWPPFSEEGWWVLLRLEKMLPAKLDLSTRKRIINDLYEEWIHNEVSAAVSRNKTEGSAIEEGSNDAISIVHEHTNKSHDKQTSEQKKGKWLKFPFKQ